jgi:hypothetical protein
MVQIQSLAHLWIWQLSFEKKKKIEFQILIPHRMPDRVHPG